MRVNFDTDDAPQKIPDLSRGRIHNFTDATAVALRSGKDSHFLLIFRTSHTIIASTTPAASP